MFLSADICGTQDAHPFGIRGHESVLDSVVHHLDEVAGPVWSAVQVTQIGGTWDLLSSRSARYLARPGSQLLEYRIEITNYLFLAPDHHAVAAFQAPHATARSHVHVVDLFFSELFCASKVIDVIGITPIDDR